MVGVYFPSRNQNFILLKSLVCLQYVMKKLKTKVQISLLIRMLTFRHTKN